MTITDEHERLHPVEDPSPHWSDSLYFNAWDPATATFLITRMAVLGNEKRATAGMLVWVDGAPAYAYGFDHEGLPASDWDVMQLGGLTYRMQRALESWALQLDDGPNRAHLTWDGTSSVVDYSDNERPLPRAVAWGHYEQSCRVHGDLVLGDRRIAFDGWGQRDHSWGFRHWAGLHQWHWITGLVDANLSFNLFEVHEHDGTITCNGFVHGPDGDRFVVGGDRRFTTDDNGAPTGVDLRLDLADGSTCQISGQAAGFPVPVRPADDQPVVVHEVPSRFTIDGREGFGIYEHLVTQFD